MVCVYIENSLKPFNKQDTSDGFKDILNTVTFNVQINRRQKNLQCRIPILSTNLKKNQLRKQNNNDKTLSTTKLSKHP